MSLEKALTWPIGGLHISDFITVTAGLNVVTEKIHQQWLNLWQ